MAECKGMREVIRTLTKMVVMTSFTLINLIFQGLQKMKNVDK